MSNMEEIWPKQFEAELTAAGDFVPIRSAIDTQSVPKIWIKLSKAAPSLSDQIFPPAFGCESEILILFDFD